MKKQDKTTTISAGKVVLLQFEDQEGKQNIILCLLLAPIVAKSSTYDGQVHTAFATDVDTGNYVDKYPDLTKNWKLSVVNDNKLIAWFYEQVDRRNNQENQTKNPTD